MLCPDETAPGSLDCLVHAPQSVGERMHHRDREVRRLVHQEEEALLIDRRHLAIGLGAHGRPSRRTVDQRHLAENATTSERFHDVTTALDDHLDGSHDKLASPLSPWEKITSPAA